MVNQDTSRRLAVIVHADVAGSTALVQRDETLAHKRITEAFQRFSSIILNYGGTVHEIRGDALVAEFARASDAVCAALAFQHSHTEQLLALSDEIKPTVRIGVSLGEVVFADNTVTGAGVVLAQRVEQIAQPGGVCLQGAVYEAVPRRLPFNYENLGEQEVKGFEEPVRVYAIGLKDGESIPAPERLKETSRWWKPAAAAVVVTAVIVLGWFRPWEPQVEPASVDRMAFPLPDKPSIAVLPFADLTGDPERAVLVDGITDSIITTLSRAPDLFVIDRGSSHTYKGKATKIKEVAEELGVHFVLQGGIQASGERLRINAQLNDALTGRTIWADDFDKDLSDMFAVQDEVAGAVLSELEVNLSQGEQARIRRRQTESVGAFLYFLQGLEHHHIFSAGEQTTAQKLLQKAIEIDPEFASARAYLGFTYIKQARNKWVPDIDEARRVGEAHIRKAIEIAPDNVDALKMLGDIYYDAGDREKTLALQRRALAQEPNHADNLATHSYTLAHNGRPEEGLPLIKRAMRLSPNYPSGYLSALGWCEFFLGNYDAAIEANEARHQIIPNSELPMIYLIIMYSAAGRMQEASEMVVKLRAIVPGYRISNFKTLAGGWFPPDTFVQLIDYMEAAGIENDLDS